jgi:hypothetical protein
VEYKIKKNETHEEYKKRLCQNKDLYDLRWEDIAALWFEVTDDKKSPDWFRKWWRNYYEGYEDGKKESVGSNEILNEIELKKIELLEERKKLQTVRVEYNKIAREKARRELLFEYAREGFEKLEVVDPKVNIDLDFNPLQQHLLSFGDIHYGKKFKSLHNEYSEEIAINRMNKIIEDTITYLNKNNITHLNVLNLADSIEGMTLRTSQLQSLQSGFVDQVIKFSKYYAKWIRELSKYTNVNLHHIESSNHTEIRPHNSSRNEYPAEDMERIIGMYIHDVLEGHDRVKINLHKGGIAEFSLLDYKFVALHGHQLKGKRNALKDLSFHRRKFYDYCLIGHWHNLDITTVGEGLTNNLQTIQVPSVMGSDEYADSFFTGAKAGALITTFTKGKGLTDIHNIILN